MNLKLEELRKRLLDPTNPLPPGETIYRSSAEAAASPGLSTDGEAVADPVGMPETDAASVVFANSAVREPIPGGEEDTGKSKAGYNVAQAVAKVFDSVRTHQEHLAELAKSLDAIEQMAQSASRAFEPIEAFHVQMRKLSSTFEPMRSFQQQLGAMAETFEPMKVLHDQMGDMAQAFELHLVQLARCLEPAKKFQAQIIRLAKSLEAAGELQVQFIELSEAFRGTLRSGGATAVQARN